MSIGIQERISKDGAPRIEVMLDGANIDVFVAHALAQYIQSEWSLQVDNHFRPGSHRGRLDVSPSDILHDAEYKDFTNRVHAFVEETIQDPENVAVKAEFNQLLISHRGQWADGSKPHSDTCD